MLDHVAIRVPDRVASRRFYHSGYVGAFVLDPDGNTVEAVNRKR
jgi:catechol 2,3-dioxygenase-like lactoylglutathione lyase family enzyme